jgi:hypothetical protein
MQARNISCEEESELILHKQHPADMSCEIEKDQRRIAEMTAVAYSRNTNSEDGGKECEIPHSGTVRLCVCVCVRAKSQILTLKHSIK